MIHDIVLYMKKHFAHIPGRKIDDRDEIHFPRNESFICIDEKQKGSFLGYTSWLQVYVFNHKVPKNDYVELMNTLPHVTVATQGSSSNNASSVIDSKVPGASPLSKPPIKRKCTEKDDTDHPVSEDANCRKRAHCVENE